MQMADDIVTQLRAEEILEERKLLDAARAERLARQNVEQSGQVK